MPLPLDPQLTLDTFVVGAGNRLAYAAACRVAEAPGATYNPLFVYSASGLGKTHLLMGIGQRAERLHPELRVHFETQENLVSGVAEAIKSGREHGVDAELGTSTLLLLDDVQFLAGQHRAQEELLRIWDQVAAAGGQVVLTSDRPPPEIDALDDRLLSRFSGGLIMDIAAPDFETRVAIVRRKAEQRGQQLGDGVAEAVARMAFGNVRELQGGLNRVLAAQELEGRAVGAADVPELLGGAGTAQGSEFDSFLADLTETVEGAFADLPVHRQINEAVERWRGEGYATRRLEEALENDDVGEPEALIRGFERDVDRLREITGEISALEPDAEALSRRDVLRDPERMPEAEALLEAVRARHRPLPPPPSGGGLGGVAVRQDALAARAARSVAERPGEQYNPLFLHGPADGVRSALLGAAARRMADTHPARDVAYLRADDFVEELIEALEQNQVDAWRERYRRAGALFLDGVEALEQTERAQDEVFHLFDALLRSGAQLVFGATVAPAELERLEDRLRTRLASGLVAEVEPASLPDAGAESRITADVHDAARARPVEQESSPAGEAGDQADAVQPAAPVRDAAGRAPLRGGRDEWFQSREKIVWLWPYPDEWLVEELN